MAARPAGAEPTGYGIAREPTKAGSALIVGIDEVGRGAWAGPVVVCAAIARAGFPEPPGGLTDSKRLTAKRRSELAAELPAWVEAYAFGSASPQEMDVVLLDGKHDYIGSPWRVRTAVKADLRSVSVAAASVLAKVHRDALIAELGETCPGFAFADNAGYPAPAHVQALTANGPTPYHRLSWSYLDDLPQWRHLKVRRPEIEGQLTLL